MSQKLSNPIVMEFYSPQRLIEIIAQCDLYVHASDAEIEAMSAQQVQGMETFAAVGCTACHSGPAFNGAANLPVGQGFFAKFPTYPGSEYDKRYDLTADEGRYTVTKQAAVV